MPERNIAMSQTLTISDDLYMRLEAAARARGLNNVQQLLENWQAREEERFQREMIVRKIDVLREQLYEKYGEFPDSTELVRADRER
jgi:hypothetical protein